MKSLDIKNIKFPSRKTLLFSLLFVLMGSAVGAGVTAYLFIRSVSFSVEMRVLKSAVAERNINSVTYLYGITRKNIVKETHLINHAKIFYNQRHNYTNVKKCQKWRRVS